MNSFTIQFFLFFYRTIIFPLGLSIFWLLKFINPKIKQGFKTRENQPWLSQKKLSNVVWIHTSSGEIEYAKPLIRELKKQTNLKVLVTYFSPSVIKNLASSQDVDFFCPVPWDTPLSLKQFIKHHKPKILLISKTDIWPELLFQSYISKIPRYLFSATFKDKIPFLQKIYFKIFLPLFDKVFVVSKHDFKNLKNISSVPSEAIGDTRFDQCIFRVEQNAAIKNDLFKKTFRYPTLVAGSTWPEDEKVLFPFFSKLKNDLNFILVPHEPTTEHILKISKNLNDHGIDFVEYSKTSDWPEGKLLLIDHVGILADIYKFGQYAFVGGSFKKSVHSVMEPLACGLKVFVGPHHENNREAIEFKNIIIESEHPVTVINSAEHLFDEFNKSKWDDKHKLKLQEKFKLNCGATNRLMEKIKGHF